MMMKKIVMGIVLCCVTAFAGVDNMRIWRTQGGERIEGRFVRVLLGKVQLETADGKKAYIPLKELSKWDKKHLSSIYIPDVEIRYSDSSRAKFRSKNALADDIIRIVTGKASVKSREKIECSTLHVEEYLIGEEVASDDYRLLCKGASPLKFTEENDYCCEFSLETESRKYMEYNRQLRGCLYAGYVVIVLDQKNQVVDFRTDLSWIKKENLDKLRQFQKDDFFSSTLKSRPIPRPKNTGIDRVGVQ